MSKTPDRLNLSENPTGPPNRVRSSATLQSPINSDNDFDSLDSYLAIDLPPSCKVLNLISLISAISLFISLYSFLSFAPMLG